MSSLWTVIGQVLVALIPEALRAKRENDAAAELGGASEGS